MEVDEVLGLMGNEWTEVPANDAVPGWAVSLVEFRLDESGNILFNVEPLKSMGGDIDRILLHLKSSVTI